jgi:phage-related protein
LPWLLTWVDHLYIRSDINIAFVGSALDDLREFPIGARREAGHQLDRVQRGLEPDDWKPMPGVGAGVREIRVRDEAGGPLRVVHVAAFAEAVYVLHAFGKKTPRTAKRDLDLAAARSRQIGKGRAG